MYKTLKTLFIAGAIAYAASRAAYSHEPVSHRLGQAVERTLPIYVNQACNKAVAGKIVSRTGTEDNGNLASFGYLNGQLIDSCQTVKPAENSVLITKFAYRDFNPSGFSVLSLSQEKDGTWGAIQFSKGIIDEYVRYGSKRTKLTWTYNYMTSSQKARVDFGNGLFGNSKNFMRLNLYPILPVFGPDFFNLGAYKTGSSSGYFFGVNAENEHIKVEITDFRIKNEVSLDKKIDFAVKRLGWKKFKKILSKIGVSGGKTQLIYKKRGWTNGAQEETKGIARKLSNLEKLTITRTNNNWDGRRIEVEYSLGF